MWFFSYSWWIWFGALGFGVLEVYIVGWVKCVQWCVKGVVGMCSGVLPTGDYHIPPPYNVLVANNIIFISYIYIYVHICYSST